MVGRKCAFFCTYAIMEETRMIIKNISNAILYEMGEEEITISLMAEKCNVSKRTICGIVGGRKKGLTLNTIVKICNNTNIKYSDIFNF